MLIALAPLVVWATTVTASGYGLSTIGPPGVSGRFGTNDARWATSDVAFPVQRRITSYESPSCIALNLPYSARSFRGGGSGVVGSAKLALLLNPITCRSLPMNPDSTRCSTKRAPRYHGAGGT